MLVTHREMMGPKFHFSIIRRSTVSGTPMYVVISLTQYCKIANDFCFIISIQFNKRSEIYFNLAFSVSRRSIREKI